MNENIKKELTSILKNSKRIDYQGIVLYLIDKIVLDRVLELELLVRMENEEKGIKKRNHFYDYAKIINPKYPAFKYTLSMKHKKRRYLTHKK